MISDVKWTRYLTDIHEKSYSVNCGPVPPRGGSIFVMFFELLNMLRF